MDGYGYSVLDQPCHDEKYELASFCEIFLDPGTQCPTGSDQGFAVKGRHSNRSNDAQQERDSSRGEKTQRSKTDFIGSSSGDAQQEDRRYWLSADECGKAIQ